MMAKFGMTLCALGIAEEMRDEGIASNTLWPRTLVATAAVQNLLGGDEAMGRARKPEVYSDAAYVILNKPVPGVHRQHRCCARTCWWNPASPTCRCTTACRVRKLGVDFWVDGVNPPGYTGPRRDRKRGRERAQQERGRRSNTGDRGARQSRCAT